MNKQLITPCGKYESNNSKPFTKETLDQHINDCSWCQAGFSPSGTDNLDIPDGAYWAMKLEEEGWFP